MKHRIDPKIDCVFNALLGAERNRRLLIHFINAILADGLTAPLVEVEILNPYNEREFLDDKLSIVDVKARDRAGRVYPIEIQLLNVADLPARILYSWADRYSAQLQDGEDYNQLKPTYSIWLLGQTLRPKLTKGVHRFRLRDEQGLSLNRYRRRKSRRWPREIRCWPKGTKHRLKSNVSKPCSRTSRRLRPRMFQPSAFNALLRVHPLLEFQAE